MTPKKPTRQSCQGGCGKKKRVGRHALWTCDECQGSDDPETPEELAPSDDEFWEEKRTVEQKDCSACGEDHEMTYHPVAHPPDVGRQEIRGHVNEDATILAAGLCENTDTMVFVYSGPFEEREAE